MEYKNNINYIITWKDNYFNESHRINLKGSKVSKFLNDISKIERYINIEVKSLERGNTLELLINKLNDKNINCAGNKNCDYITIVKYPIQLKIGCKDVYTVIVEDLTENTQIYCETKTYKTLGGLIRYINNIG